LAETVITISTKPKNHMSTPNDPVTETAKAAQEVAKSVGKGLDAGRAVGAFIAKYIAGPLEQGIGIVTDRLSYARWERQIRLMRRADEFLAQQGLSGPTRAVPLKIAIPLLQAASIEEDDGLQDLWAILLANAANAQSQVEIERGYISILEQLTPVEAQILKAIYALPFEAIHHNGAWTVDLPRSARPKTKNDDEAEKSASSLLSNEVKLALGNLDRLGCLNVTRTMGGGEMFSYVNPTFLGAAFVRACQLPRPA
jgi:hypothetical protein